MMSTQLRVFSTLGQAKAEGFMPDAVMPTIVWKMVANGGWVMAVVLPMKPR